MADILVCDFSAEKRQEIAKYIKYFGVKRTRIWLHELYQPSVANALIRNICRNYGW